MFNFITFENPPESNKSVIQPCLPPRPKSFRTWLRMIKNRPFCGGIDYKKEPCVHYDHLAKVLEAKNRLLTF